MSHSSGSCRGPEAGEDPQESLQRHQAPYHNVLERRIVRSRLVGLGRILSDDDGERETSRGAAVCTYHIISPIFADQLINIYQVKYGMPRMYIGLVG